MSETWWDRHLGQDTTLETFAGWVGDHNSESKVIVRRHVAEQKYNSILDCGCGLCSEYDGYVADKYPIGYMGLDATARFVEMAHARQIVAVPGSIENIPFDDEEFRVVFTRHVLEHLSYYEKALAEMVRVAITEVIVVFFIPPHDEEDKIHVQDGDLYHNCYNRGKLERHVMGLPGVESLAWQRVSDHEVILHVRKVSE